MSAVFRAGDKNKVIVNCSANAMGPVYYQWQKLYSFNDSWVNPSHRAVNITSPNLKFNDIKKEDKGIYRCVVTNDDGSVVSDNATIKVYGKYSP